MCLHSLSLPPFSYSLGSSEKEKEICEEKRGNVARRFLLAMDKSIGESCNWTIEKEEGKERRRMRKKESVGGGDQGWLGYKFKTEVGHVRFGEHGGGFSRFKHALQTKLAT